MEKTKQKIRSQRTYLAKDYETIKADLLKFTRNFFGDDVNDLSDSGIPGLIVELQSAAADKLTYYLDHQFRELDYDTAIEVENIQNLIEDSGVSYVNPSPATVELRIGVVVQAKRQGSSFVPKEDYIPVIRGGSSFTSFNGVNFELIDDIDFAEKDEDGKLLADIQIESSSGSNISYFKLFRTGLAVSGSRITETVTVGDTFVPFREIILSNPNITEIQNVRDSEGNVYYEVENLAQDVVFLRKKNKGVDRATAKERIELRPAPYRYVRKVDINDRLTTIRFGSGDSEELQNDLIPDPTDLALPLYNKPVLSRQAITPSNLLKTDSLGVSPTNTTLTIEYRYGGGRNHSVNAETIRSVNNLDIIFNPGTPLREIEKSRNSVSVNNLKPASGGNNAPSVEELRSLIPFIKSSQSRISSAPDVLARVYTMPTNFGKVVKAAIKSNKNGLLNSQLFVLSENVDGSLRIADDTTKENLARYLNEFRIISDSIDILDGKILNYGVNFTISSGDGNKNTILANCITALQNYLQTSKFQIDQPIFLDEIRNLIYNIDGVVGVSKLEFVSINGTFKNREYNSAFFDPKVQTSKSGILFPPENGIFELKYPNYDIKGKVE